MSDLIKIDSNLWGEDPHHDLAVAKRTNSELFSDAKKSVYRVYMLGLRHEFETDELTRKILERNNPATGGFDELLGHLSNLIRPETEEVFKECLNDLLLELDHQRKSPGSLYLISTDTGAAIMPLNSQMIYQPPDFIGDDGKKHKAKQILHPKISAPLAIKIHEDARLLEKLKKVEGKLAFEHVRNPNSIRNVAIEFLAKNGYISESLDDDFKQINLEFGKEHQDVFQSINPAFHRHVSFGRTLARQIMSEAGSPSKYEIGDVKTCENAKFHWYSVTVKLRLLSEFPSL